MQIVFLITAISTVLLSQLCVMEARSYTRPARHSSLTPYSEGALLYRTEQLDPALMRRDPPEEVLARYIKQNQEREALLNELRAGGSVNLFNLMSTSRSRYYYAYSQ